MSRPLTHQQQLVYDFIRDKIGSRGYGPTVREIGEYMSIKSPNGVMCHLRALERKGMIIRAANKSRAIELTEPLQRGRLPNLPVGGSVQQAICQLREVIDSSVEFDLSSILAGKDRFGLQVLDESLQELSIRRGDLLIVQRDLPPQLGKMLLAKSSESGHPQLVRIIGLDSQQVQWQTVSRGFATVRADQVHWLGQVVGVVRKT